MINWDVLQGSPVALIAVTGEAFLQEYMTRRADRRERHLQFDRDMLFGLQTAIGDLAIAAEQILYEKRVSETWTAEELGSP